MSRPEPRERWTLRTTAAAGAAAVAISALACRSPPAPVSAGEIVRGNTPAGEQPQPSELVGGVIVDPEHSALYLMDPSGGVSAVDLRSGARLWRTESAARPLLLHDGRLLAQVETAGRPGVLPLVTLDVEQRGALIASVEVPLPAGVEASIDEQLSRAFSVTAAYDSDGVLVVWRFLSQSMSGMPQPLEQHQQSGAARLLPSGAVAGAEPPDQAALPNDLETLRRAESIEGPLWSTTRIAATVRALDGGGVALRRWERTTGAALPDTVISTRPAVVHFASADGRHLLVGRLPDRTPGPGTAVFEWLIVSLESGMVEATVRRPLWSAPFVVAGPVLVHEWPAGVPTVEGPAAETQGGARRLVGVELATGVELWSTPVRDPTYAGPLPARPSGG